MGSDVVIVGGGPAALAAAVACAETGMTTVVLAGTDAAWPANYGIWVDEAEALGLGPWLGPVWTDAGVVYGDADRRWLGRRYARVAKRRLRAHLLERLEALDARVLFVRAASVEHGPTGSTVTDAAGVTHAATVVIDASGHRPAFVHRRGAPTSFQAAIGMAGTPTPNPWDAERMTFMDMRTDHVDDELGQAAPSFLYVMPMAPQRVFVEETSLVRAPALPFPVLRRRLLRRLDRLGITLSDVDATEVCLIPMDTPLPDMDQRVLGFGAAASFVQPVSGYSLARSFGTAPDVARVLADGLDRGTPPAELVRDLWRVVWTEDDLIRRELHLFGSQILASLDAADQRRFFQAFFEMPPERWTAYLAARGDVAGVTRAMGSMLIHAGVRIRWTLLRSGMRHPGVLLRSVV